MSRSRPPSPRPWARRAPKRVALAVLAAGVGASLAACEDLQGPDAAARALCSEDAAPASVAAAGPRPGPDAGPFPILAWYGVPRSLLTPAAFDRIAAAGFTLNYTPQAPREMNLEILDLAAGAGLGVLVEDFDLRPDSAFDLATVEEAVAAYRDHAALFGYQLRGEPPATLFPRMGRVAETIRALDPDHLVYSNLYPDYATADRLAATSYEGYLTDFLETVDPRVLTAAYYPFQRRGFRRGYFAFMDRLRAAAIRARADLWGFAMTAHIEPAFPSPRESWIRFQVYGALAYGARGITFFPYGLPRSTTEDFRLALIDSAGAPTPLYDGVRRINAEIHTLAPVLAGLRSVRVCWSEDAPGGRRIEWGLEWVERSSGLPVLLGRLADPEGRPYLLLVSTDWEDEGVVELQLSDSATALVEIRRREGEPPGRYPTAAGRVSVRLEPGDGRLFRVE